MTPPGLVTALPACAAGLYPLEAGVGLLIANGTFLHRSDFTIRFILHGGTSSGTHMAAVDWEAATTALAAGELPCSGGERRILALAASLANGVPVALRDAIAGMDDRNAGRNRARRPTGSSPAPERSGLCREPGPQFSQSRTGRAEDRTDHSLGQREQKDLTEWAVFLRPALQPS